MGEKYTLEDAKQQAWEGLLDWLEDNRITDPHAPDLGDAIFEHADGAVPIYNATLLRFAADNPELALSEPEIGPAFDGKATPVNIIAANIFETVNTYLWEQARDYIQDQQDRLDDLEHLLIWITDELLTIGPFAALQLARQALPLVEQYGGVSLPNMIRKTLEDWDAIPGPEDTDA